VGQGEGDGAITDLMEESPDAKEAIFTGVFIFAGRLEEFLLEDMDAPEELLDEDDFDRARAGIDSEESTGRKDAGQQSEW
jgi:hypothetical protein